LAINAAFTHAGLTTRYRTENLYKSISCCQLKIASMKIEFQNLKIRFHKRQVSFLVVKTVKCKRGIS